MNRFSKRHFIIDFFRKIRISFILFLVLFFVFLYGLNNVSKSTHKRQAESLYNAINRSIIHCYCVEGTYPPSLSYLKEHYGLTYDESQFMVDYMPIGSNMKPDVTIIER